MRRYCLISPCRDEAAFMRRTLDSVAAQTLRPTRWVIVDDGSSDEGPAILAEYERAWDWLTVIRREDRGRRSVGPGVIDAFYAGLAEVDLSGYEYLAKLDLDLDLPPRYFETLMERMEADPRIGTCSGKLYYPAPGTNERELISEGCGDENSIGPSKFYRVACFEQIGGFVREVMWDGIDGHRCRMLGWIACSWDDPDLRCIHLRPMGSSDQGVLRGRSRHGYGQYFMGTHPAYMAASAVYRLPRPPRLLGGAAMAWGYLKSMLQRQRRYDDAEFRRFLRRYQWDCLFRGKRAAIRRASAAPPRPEPADRSAPGA